MIKNTTFGGERPIVEPLNLANDQAVFCEDCYLHTSGLDPLRGGKLVKPTCADAETLFRMGDKLICMNQWTDFVRAPNGMDKFNRVYYTQTGGLYVTSCDALVDNVVGVNLSLLKPPTVKPVPVITRGDTLSNGQFAYSWVDDNGDDIGLSHLSNAFDYANGDDAINVTVQPSTQDDVKSINVYYYDGTDYFLQRNVPKNTSTINFTPFSVDLSNPVASTGTYTATMADPVVTVVRDTTHLKETNFLITYVSIRDEETTNSPVSITVEYEDGVDCLDLSLAPTANTDIAYQRIYMEIEGEYYLIAEVAATEATYNLCPLDDDLIIDANKDSSTIIGNIFEAGDYDPAPEDIIGLKGLPNGSIAGFANDEGCTGSTGVVYVSVPYVPHAWPVEYRFPIRYKIVALRNVPEGLLVLTEGKPSLITGSTPDVMDEHELETHEACRDRRSTLEIGEAVVWSSPDGVAIYGGRSIRVISKDVWSREQWQALNPDSMLFGFYEGRLIIYALDQKKGFIYNLQRHDIIRLSEWNVHALLYDVEEDALFVARDNRLERFNEGEVLNAKWISKPHIVPAARPFNSMRLSPEGDVKVTLYKNDDELSHADDLTLPYWTKVKDNQRPFRVGSAGRKREVCIGLELVGKKRLRLFELSQDMRELV